MKARVIQTLSAPVRPVLALVTSLAIFPLLASPAALAAPQAPTYNPEHLQQLLETNVCRGCNLAGADLSVSHLLGADLRNSNLVGANLSRSNLEGADFTGADLRGAKLNGSLVSNAVFDYANLADADCTDANLSNVNVIGANLSNLNLTNALVPGTAINIGSDVDPNF